ncbi:sulfatase family protein [Candidatus Pelagisphaera phototrophica]|uniref:sulfatase family protein n=1 Tax=Candidatus Pelagisphaera phototrophica TaxID=2684113 RepID=UPI0019DC8CA4|nr:sulfatase [Candidatus Pelagisphaera phototrophica]QXD31321.1 sulfatase [Candidatus Pelagisphaera phototrophica]
MRLALCIISLVGAAAIAADRPNIVWMVSEDNSKHWLRLYEEGGAAMPNIEKLAENGLVFQNAFSNAPVCSVARSTLITGSYAPRIAAQYHRRAAMAPMPEGLRMFPHYLREAGYYTTNNSKTDYNLSDKGMWDESSNKATYRNRDSEQPFFHVQNFGRTHEGQLHFTEEFMEENATETDPHGIKVFPYHPDTPVFRYTYAKFQDHHIETDAQMGEFLARLKDDGVADDTIVFYYGDHGGVLPRGKGYAYESGLNVPLVVHAPEKWRHLLPVNAGRSVDGFVSFIDFGPTVLNLAGVDVPETMDGMPFLGEGVTARDLIRRDEAFGYADRFDEKYDLVRTFRKGKYKYIRNYQPFNFDGLFNDYRYKMLAYREWYAMYQAGELNAVQSQFFEPREAEALYDIEKDPHETNNLADDPKSASVLRDLRQRLTNQVKEISDLSFLPEPAMLSEALSNPVQFGRENQDRIGKLVDTANLSLLPFAKAKSGIAKAFKSNDPWVRYWGAIVCSSFGKEASSFSETAKNLVKNDGDNLVRVRAAEFLALIGAVKPQKAIYLSLKNAESEVEANLILNTVTLLQDGQPGYEFNINPGIFPKEWRSNVRGNVSRRLAYFTGE